MRQQKTQMSDLTSIGCLSQLFQRSPKQLEKLLAATGQKPALSLNGIRYFSAEAVEAVAAELRKQTSEEKDK